MRDEMKRLGRIFMKAGFVLVLALTVPGLYAQQRSLASPERLVRSPELNIQFHRAQTAWQSGTSLLEAKARVDRVLKVLPEDVEARKLRAQVLMSMGRPAEALRDAERAVEIDPGDGEAFLILSEAARRSGDLPKAVQALDVAAERVEDRADLHLRLSWNAVELGLLDKAEAFARIALALDRQNAAAYYQLSRVFVLSGQRDEAATVLVQGLNASILEPVAIEQDGVLKQLAGHPALAPWMRR